MTKNRFNYKFVTDPLDAARYLESLIEGFQKGSLILTDQNRQLVLKPAEIMELTIDSSRRKGRVNLSVSLSWAETPSQKQLTLSFDSLDEAGSPEIPSEETGTRRPGRPSRASADSPAGVRPSSGPPPAASVSPAAGEAPVQPDSAQPAPADQPAPARTSPADQPALESPAAGLGSPPAANEEHLPAGSSPAAPGLRTVFQPEPAGLFDSAGPAAEIPPSGPPAAEPAAGPEDTGPAPDPAASGTSGSSDGQI
ncbi:MAG: amphi-Trp domain-containing protein [Deltaproteobacteria bacterium]|jgi:amphi-Trp domain-containing protein|nr:amphi-Trp domain-containing protein [Deltaproteobacteria bacterium]